MYNICMYILQQIDFFTLRHYRYYRDFIFLDIRKYQSLLRKHAYNYFGWSDKGLSFLRWVSPTTVNVEIFAQYIFSRISRMALYARKYDVSERINQNATKRTNSYLCENLVARKCPLRHGARKFSCAKISTFTVCTSMLYRGDGDRDFFVRPQCPLEKRYPAGTSWTTHTLWPLPLHLQRPPASDPGYWHCSSELPTHWRRSINTPRVHTTLHPWPTPPASSRRHLAAKEEVEAAAAAAAAVFHSIVHVEAEAAEADIRRNHMHGYRHTCMCVCVYLSMYVVKRVYRTYYRSCLWAAFYNWVYLNLLQQSRLSHTCKIFQAGSK